MELPININKSKLDDKHTVIIRKPIHLIGKIANKHKDWPKF